VKHDTFNIGKKEHYLQGVLGEKQKLIMSAAISGVVTTLAISQALPKLLKSTRASTLFD
jgi:hypothetical protein